MTSTSLINCERKSLEKMAKFQLPYPFKKIGIAVAVFSFLALFVNAFSVNVPELRTMAKYGLLVGMLLISISKEKIEDELIAKLRMQSFTFAFIIGVVFALAQPFANYLVDVVFNSQEAFFKDTGDFEILWMLLSIQVFYFEFLKRLYK